MSGLSPVTGGAGSWTSSWSICRWAPLALPSRDKQSAPEMAITAKKEGTAHRGGKSERYPTEQPRARLRKCFGNLDLRSRQPRAPAFGEKIGFERCSGVAYSRVPRHAIRRQTSPRARVCEKRVVLHVDMARGQRQFPGRASAQFSKIIECVFERRRLSRSSFEASRRSTI